ncbi:metallophosphoesterase family protein [Alienimonas californiensis]|uniref:Phosphoesterase n=1 Tax=Alienimonas californiensis TaxID=2527989 RepID=A0A517P675_9PLAN|nr:YfcE family phosphodiesterase [Alienimonas californiensis]QDT14865.1 phosphodiesterase [Alienimonas californiensis]
MTRLAVLSDTHGRVPETAAALAVLNAHAPDLFLHCGDVGGGRYSPHGVLKELARVADGRPVYLVPGNNDRDPAALKALAAERGIDYGDPALLEVDGVRLCVTHGTTWEHEEFAEHGLDGTFHDIILSGHTHRPTWERRRFGDRSAYLLNPGACWRATPRTVALLDLPPQGFPPQDPAKWKPRFLEVPWPA